MTVEMLDVLDFMTLVGLSEAAVIGTSRGGLITMLMAAVRPTALGAAVLVDIGPVIEHDGLVRISGYVGRIPLPISWADATRMVRDLNRRHFPDVPEYQWEEVARQLYNERNGKPAQGYDQKLGKALSVLFGPVPELWPQFEALEAGSGSGRARGELRRADGWDGGRDAAATPGTGDRHGAQSGPRAAPEGRRHHRGHPPLPDRGRVGPHHLDARYRLALKGAGRARRCGPSAGRR